MSDEPELAPVTFIGFVLSLAHTAAVRFGDLPDPATGQPGRPDLQAAGQIIEILALLDEKTRGNLTPEERQFLEQLLQELRERMGAAPRPTSRIIAP
jgi:hypothetical protein